MRHFILPCHVSILAMSVYSSLPYTILHHVIIHTVRILDAIDIGLDLDHPVPVVVDAFPVVTIVTILASHEEAIRGIHEYLQGVPIEEEMSTLRFRMGMAEA
nr:hypothetical protein [Tanacetum cinerariifolium]